MPVKAGCYRHLERHTPHLNGPSLTFKYAGYIEKEQRVIARAEKMDAVKLDPDMDYAAIGGLSAEAREKLRAVPPKGGVRAFVRPAPDAGQAKLVAKFRIEFVKKIC